MEYWDLYNEEKEKINKKHLRSNTNILNPGEYHIVVNIWIINDENYSLLFIPLSHNKCTFNLNVK